MGIDGEQRIAAAREDVWTALNDPQMLRFYTPGCDSLERISENEFDGTVTVKAQVGGKLAQVGSRLIDGTARKLSGHFLANLGEHLAAGEVAPAAPMPEVPAAMFAGLGPKAWTVGLIDFAALLALIFWATGSVTVSP